MLLFKVKKKSFLSNLYSSFYGKAQQLIHSPLIYSFLNSAHTGWVPALWLAWPGSQTCLEHLHTLASSQGAGELCAPAAGRCREVPGLLQARLAREKKPRARDSTALACTGATPLDLCPVGSQTAWLGPRIFWWNTDGYSVRADCAEHELSLIRRCF